MEKRKNTKSELLLLLGCQRSGTTLLASMLAGHSEVNMLNESTTKDVLKLVGKKYSGNKLLTWREIRVDQRASKFGHFMNRLVNRHFGKRNSTYHRIRPYPTSSLSINDYMRMDAKVIYIERDKEQVVSSILNRTNMTRKQAENEIAESTNCYKHIADKCLLVDFADLVEKPIDTLKNICTYLDIEFEERMLKGTEYNYTYPNKGILKEKAKTISEYK